MTSGRISAFTDGVVAILITIMLLDMKLPEGPFLQDLFELRYGLITYTTSFFFLAIFWNNHHHLFHLVKQVSGKMLWWNMFLLFFLSFIPYFTNWLSHYPTYLFPEFLYGINILVVDVIYNLLSYEIFKGHEKGIRAFRWSYKALFSILILIVGLVLCLFSFRWIVLLASILSMVPWIIPDRQIEKQINK